MTLLRPLHCAPLAAAWLATAALAHAPGNSFLIVRGEPQGEVRLRWDVSLKDADLAVALDQDGDGEVAPAEAHRGEAALFAYALGHLAVRADGDACALRAQRPLQVAAHRDGRHLALRLVAQCDTGARTLALESRLMVEQDAAHRLLTRVQWGGPAQSAVFTARRTRQQWSRGDSAPAPWLDEQQARLWGGLSLVILLLISVVLWLGPGRVLAWLRRV